MIRKQDVKQISFIVFFTLLYFRIQAQEIRIDAHNTSLHQVLEHLRVEYGIQYSADYNVVSSCTINLTQNFSSPDEAMKSLLSSCELEYKALNGVYIIIVHPEAAPEPKPEYYFFTGRLVDEFSHEPLPFSTLRTSDGILYADASGQFNFKSKFPSTTIKASYVGYFMLDTTLNEGENQNLELTPSVIGLKEVVVNAHAQLFDNHIGEKPGQIKLNHQVATFLPGNNNNTLFNMLRLQPGVMAAAEQSGDYMIWGSYRGQNLITFDGITLFSATSQNKEIGIVNPLMISDVEVFKGGYGVDKADRVGGIIQLTGKSGNPNTFTADATMNNQTMGGRISVPLKQNITLQGALRQSYNSVLDWSNHQETSVIGKDNTYEPEYAFRDVNLKLSGSTKQGDVYSLGFLANADNSYSEVLNSNNRLSRAWENSLEKNQRGVSANYRKQWKKWGSTSLTAAYSTLSSESYTLLNYTTQGKFPITIEQDDFYENGISEFQMTLQHRLAATEKQDIHVGVEYVFNETYFVQDTLLITRKPGYQYLNRVNFYLKDHYQITSFLSVEPGLRVVISPAKVYYLPRFSAAVEFAKHFKLYYAWGKYIQFINEVPLIDIYENQEYFWTINDDRGFPVVESQHHVWGFKMDHSIVDFSVEGFYKNYQGLTKFTRGIRRQVTLTEGEGRAYGVDFMLSKRVVKHDFWIVYSLSKAEENFPRNNHNEFILAPQNQTHEIKAAGTLNFTPWYISMNYVYGSGFYNTITKDNPSPIPYNRFDVALLYKFNTQTFNLESGISVQNVFNAENVSFNGFAKLPGNQTIYSKGIPFTPSIFVNIGF